MEELTDIKTRVNTSKLYQCQVSFGLTLFSRERWSQYVTQSKFEGIFNSHRNSDQSNQGVKGDGNHTQYWESDRSRSTFSIPCLPDGTFDFVNSTESWPVPGSLFYSYHCTLCYLKKKNVESSSSSSCLHKVCVEDIECLLDPPSVPSHPEYAVLTQGPPGQQK